MRQESRTARAQQIEDIAYQMLDEKGFEGLSIQAIAKSAKASNETIYRWYGDKLGLFETLIQKNAAQITAQIGVDSDASPKEAIFQLGQNLLGVLLGPRAVALNRAAAADPTGKLGAALGKSGRDAVMPYIATQFDRAIQARLFTGSTEELAELWVRLLIGDMQIRRVTHAIPQLTEAQIKDRSHQALDMLSKIFPAP